MINDYEAVKPITEDISMESEGARVMNDNTMTNDDVISTLNGLIETCKDGQEGFKEAAEGVERSDLKSLFYECSQQRSQFAGELQSLVRELGGDPETSGSITGTIHRGWINIKSAVTGQDETAILNEAERGEDSAVNAYKDALEQELPANVRTAVQNQANTVKATHDKIKGLRDAVRAATN
jgi:uncharacterized protein (TIGR02284 family)